METWPTPRLGGEAKWEGLLVSKEERHRIYEYAMDRKNREIQELQDKILDMEVERGRHDANVIVAEIVLFLFGVFVGAALMRSYGWRFP